MSLTMPVKPTKRRRYSLYVSVDWAGTIDSSEPIVCFSTVTTCVLLMVCLLKRKAGSLGSPVKWVLKCHTHKGYAVTLDSGKIDCVAAGLAVVAMKLVRPWTRKKRVGYVKERHMMHIWWYNDIGRSFTISLKCDDDSLFPYLSQRTSLRILPSSNYLKHFLLSKTAVKPSRQRHAHRLVRCLLAYTHAQWCQSDTRCQPFIARSSTEPPVVVSGI